MPTSTTLDFATASAFFTSLGLGLLMGLERERRPGTVAGLRSFALVALLGSVCALLAEEAASPWLLPAAMLALAVMMIAAERPAGGSNGKPADITTSIALLLCFAYGAMAWRGYSQLAVALALLTTALLYFKTELHAVTHKLSRDDVVSFLQFAVISLIVLPLLPDHGYGPYGALNPYRIWLMVVLVAGFGLAGYLALRLKHATTTPLLGVLGGLISSTATSFVFARAAGANASQTAASTLVILIANLVLLLRIALIAAVVAPAALPTLAPVLLLALLAGAWPPFRLWRRTAGDAPAQAIPFMSNPLELKTALVFGAVYGLALLLTAWLHERAGAGGLYAVAPVLGLTDMDAITLSALKLFASGQVQGSVLATAVVLALAANLAFKVGIAAVLGSRALGLAVLRGYLPVLAGLLLGLVLVWR